MCQETYPDRVQTVIVSYLFGCAKLHIFGPEQGGDYAVVP